MGGQISVVKTQVNLNKNQVQQLLLGIAFVLRDLDLSCFTEPEEHIPDFLAESCIQKEDALVIESIVERLNQVVFDHLK